MTKAQILIVSLLSMMCFSCIHTKNANQNAAQPKRQFPLAVEQGKFFEKDGHKYLYGGELENQHFDITNYLLNDDQFHFGIGREQFPALLHPSFLRVSAADSLWKDDDRFLLASKGGETKAYSIEDLTHHEVVNDSLGGEPVFAAYCVLADLGAMYDRTIGGREFTFALSGYTYFDPEVWDGLDGFVMWDRETESLWWPLIGKAVSGKMLGTPMKVLDEKFWKQTTWKDVRDNYPQAKVLKSGQDFKRPGSWWRHYNDATPVNERGKAIAPRWGENKKIKG